MRSAKIQSAMEFLMTYGWAVLIIGIVLGALAGLGFFNGNLLSPKLPPGSCNVYRPNGPGSTSFMNLVGTCNGELPEYVAKFNGVSSYISTGTAGLPTGSNPFSIFAWINPSSVATTQNVIYSYGTAIGGNAIIFSVVSGGDLKVGSGTGGTVATSTIAVPAQAWSFVGLTYSSGGNSVIFYKNGASQVESLSGSAFDTLSSNSIIGESMYFNTQYFEGSIANVQVYNVSFSSNDMNTLYDEGIGGAPIALPWLVAWWPLNGDSNDYSGNGNNGNAISVVYTNSWYNGYSAP